MTSFSVRSRPALFTAFLLLVAMPILVAQAAEPETILIKNVHLIDRVAVAEDALVNILITDGKLNVVTEDDIAPEDAELAVDAQSGFLLGNLNIGTPPSFLILDQDPRKNFEVLRNTQAHERFAVRMGVIVRNDLPQLAAM